MLRSFHSLALRQLGTRKLRSLLTGLGVVLGVAMVFGVLLLVATIRGTWDNVIDSAWGKTDFVLTGKGNGLMPSRDLDRVAATRGVEHAGAMIGATFVRLDRRGKPVKGLEGQLWVAGYDPESFAPYDFNLADGRSMRSGRELMVEQSWAKDHGVEVGERIAVATPTGRARLPVVGIVRLENGMTLGGAGIATMPLAAARRMMDIPHGYHQVTVAAADRSDLAPVRRRLGGLFGSGVEIKTPTQLGEQIEQQTNALNVVLYFFSGVALFVGGFLILNSFNMTVLQRMREIGMLRTLGASRAMIMQTVLLEALVIGVLGTLGGLAVGLLLASGLIELMRGLGLPVGSLVVAPGAAVAAVAIGLVVTALGALWPARRAGRISPIRAVLGTGEVRRTPRLRRAFIGLALFLPGLVFAGDLWMGEGSGTAASGMLGTLLTMVMFAGMAIAAPFVIMPLIRLLAVPLRALVPAGGRLAADAVSGNALRTSATAVALTIGLSVVVVNTAMSASFIGTVDEQMDSSYARDFTVQASGFTIEQGGGPGVPRSLRERVAAMPEAGTVTPLRALLMHLPSSRKDDPDGLALGIDPARYGRVDTTPVRDGSLTAALAGVARGGVLVGTDYAAKSKLQVGDRVTLAGPRGTRRAPVVGTLAAMTAMGGNQLRMSLDTMKAVYGHTADAQLLVKARSESDRASLERRVDHLIAADYPALELQSAADTKDQISKEISQQFNLFNAIVVIAVIVSLLGVINTLAMSVIERTREIGVLRALGASRWQVRQTMLDESLLITLSGAIAGLLMGVLIAFFWIRGLDNVMPGISLHFPVTVAITVAVAAVVLGTLAAVLPARRAAGLKVIDALTYE